MPADATKYLWDA
jgi:uncharacterized protein with HEPN domain